MTAAIRVFVSSTWRDLAPERERLLAGLLRMRDVRFVGMEHFGSRDEDTRAASLDEVDGCDLFVGVIGARYGSGIVEAEYRRARADRLPCFVYLKEPAPDPARAASGDEDAAKLLALRDELRRSHTCARFRTPDELATLVLADLHRFIQEGGRAAVARLVRAAILPAASVFQRVRLDRFVGREWLLREVDAFLAQHDRGVFVLEAGAGLGKSTFLARLVTTRRYVHHFVELAPGAGGVVAGIKNLAAQLVDRWSLSPHVLGDLEGDVVRPGFLGEILVEAAARRDALAAAHEPAEKIILVVDALDEAGAPPLQNVLGLPRTLPAGAYLVVSQRPVAVPLRVEAPRRVVRLDADAPSNIADMRAYLEAAAARPAIAQVLAAHGYGPGRFVEELARKCRGVWIYLHYVVAEIEQGHRTPLDLDALPEDVWQYYAQSWKRWRDAGEERWYAKLLPTIGALGAAQEDLPLPLLAAVGGDAEPRALERLLREEWSPFLVWTEAAGGPAVRLYHASLREFLDGRIDRGRLTRAEQALAAEMAGATRDAHARLADRALGAWGGLEAGLPGLADPASRDADGGYGMRRVVAHLAAAGRDDHLFALLTLERRRGDAPVENTWYATREAMADTEEYLDDLTVALRSAETALDDPARRAAALGRAACYALHVATVVTLAQRIPPTLLAALVARGEWTPAQGLTYARKIVTTSRRATALVLLAALVPESLVGTLLAAVEALAEPDEQAWAIARLAPVLRATHLARLREAAERLPGSAGVLARAAVVPRMAEAERERAGAAEQERAAAAVEDEVRAIAVASERALALAVLARAMEAAGFAEARWRALGDAAWTLACDEEAWLLSSLYTVVKVGSVIGDRVQGALAQILRDRFRELEITGASSVEFLVEMAPVLPMEFLRAEIRTYGTAAAVGKALFTELFDQSLAALAPRLPAAEGARLVDEAVQRVRRIEDVTARVRTCARFAGALPEAALDELLDEIEALDDEASRAEALFDLARAPALPDRVQDRIVRVIATMQSNAVATMTIAAVAPLLGAACRGAVSREIKRLARKESRSGSHRTPRGQAFRMSDSLGHALGALAPHLAAGELEEHLQLAATLGKDLSNRSGVVAGRPLVRRMAALGALDDAIEWADRLSEPRSTPLRVELLPWLAPEVRKRLVSSVMSASEGDWAAAPMLAQLAPSLDDDEVEEALALARSVGDASHRARALLQLARHGSTERRERIGLEALALAVRIGVAPSGVDARWVLAEVDGAHAPLPVVRQALVLARTDRRHRITLGAVRLAAQQLDDPLLADPRGAPDRARTARSRGMRQEPSGAPFVRHPVHDPEPGEAADRCFGISGQPHRARVRDPLVVSIERQQREQAEPEQHDRDRQRPAEPRDRRAHAIAGHAEQHARERHLRGMTLLEVRDLVRHHRVHLAPAQVLEQEIGEHHGLAAHRERVRHPRAPHRQHVDLAQPDSGLRGQLEDPVAQRPGRDRVRRDVERASIPL